MPPQTSILLLGAGELGTAILHSLTTHPAYSPTTTHLAILRRAATLASTDPTTEQSLASLSARGITFEAGDFTSTPSPELIAIFKKYDVVIQAGGYGAPRGTLLRIAEAAVAAGVKRFFPWQFGVDYEAFAAAESGHGELFGEMLAVRELLRGQRGTGWTVVSTGLFMSFLFLQGFGVVDLEGRVVRGLGAWEDTVTVTDVEGIGRVVAEVVFEPEGTENRVVYAAGDTVSYGEVADVVEEVFGGEFKRELWDREYLRKRLEHEPGNVMLKYQNVFGAGFGVSWEMERTLNYQRGMRLTDLREYVEENKD
ncbi:NAD(P)-binding protein [Parachaetomium inaequale]|uniref:NAD(P)-binding protein n=1 Tax=Parachaetomium inaequale TaxID=2588326 RepID=A0AAN6SPY0_9PEZI|nr:NAD(P)-binding protein [Parachaetomium inaequale]